MEVDRAVGGNARGSGVAAASGTIEHRKVLAFATGSYVVTEEESEVLCRLIDRAAATGIPVIGIRGASPEAVREGVGNLAAYARLLDASIRCSGVVPQINVVAGAWLGGSSLGAALGDICIAVEGASTMYMNNPDAVKAVTAQNVSEEVLGGAGAISNNAGIAHLVAPDLGSAIEYARYALSFLGDNSLSPPPRFPRTDDPERDCAAAESVIPDSRNAAYDVKDVLKDIVDDSELLELQEGWAQNMVTAFGRLDGEAVGIVASQPAILAGTLDIDSSIKAARFVRLCDQFNVPLLTLLDVPGFRPGVDEEYRGIIRHGAKLVYAFAEATVPRITLIARKAYGGAYIVMNSRHIRADLSLAWPTAEIAVMGAEGAAKVIHRREVAAAADPVAREKELVEEYREAFSNPYLAAERGYVDAVIRPAETRRVLIRSYAMLRAKREVLPPRKHGNIPL